MNFTPKETNFATTVKKIIKECKDNPHEPISVNKIVESENCEKRRLYDLFNVLCAVGLCTKTMHKLYLWNGDENMLRTIQQEYERVESLVISRDMWDIFKMPESPPIGQLTLAIILVYLFFGTEEMTLKQICLIMTQKRSKMNRLLRRLYLAAFFLEQIGVITHASHIGSYKLAIDTETIISTAFADMKARYVFPIDSIASQLATIDNNYLDGIKATRKELLIQKMKASHISVANGFTHEVEQDQDQELSPDPLSPVKMIELY
ncbi:hypothetical protein TVAG_451430 [Trichomonas vaginalis G3]|uniref:E2F/DP family winged-helix DNA-binding domain-containing protein n=1 Tax=Trichomonas vaginalis (strain ATCC PRA-98 / G3) TaxID=412133 RepID=A2FDA3_TRIV3|nr:e2F-like (mammalian transcription factor) family [Trichomonas vaginalis G3]EAX97105.1 hypothetical protein TVAG_451430 [Trichomonas vaginalis G3]KAI5513220.1 e2F-like (mammalian transcription factor) family [Trichomonas vaginalis G3]|eukprot:XP_001310035.1 hypothetical protein [Trichomonas vaginalis G3]